MPDINDNLTVTVIIPAWNAGDDLDRCLAAVLKSDYPLAECIVVDDASTEPSTAEIARRHEVKLVTMDRQGGPGPVSYTHLTLPTTCTPCRSRWSPYH